MVHDEPNVTALRVMFPVTVTACYRFQTRYTFSTWGFETPDESDSCQEDPVLSPSHLTGKPLG